MANIYCLSVAVASDFVENGLECKVAFCLPPGSNSPSDMPEFLAWQEDVKTAILNMGDQCLHPDAYTKKLALAELMHDLAAINKCYGIQIIGTPQIPTVQIISTNPFDNMIEIRFSGFDGAYKVAEKRAPGAKFMKPPAPSFNLT